MAGTGGLAGKTIMGGTIALGAHNFVYNVWKKIQSLETC